MISSVATRSFLNLGAFYGESTDKDHKDWLELLDYEWSPTPGHNPALTIEVGHLQALRLQQLAASQGTIPLVHLDVVSEPAVVRHTLFDVRVAGGPHTGVSALFTLTYSSRFEGHGVSEKPDGTAGGNRLATKGTHIPE